MVSYVNDDLVVTGDMSVQGKTELSADYIYMNNGYTTAVAQTTGFMFNYEPTGLTDTVNGSYVAGVASTSNPTVVTTGTATFAVGDFVQFSGSRKNNGLYEVLSHSGTTLTIRGVGTTATIEDFTDNQFTAHASDGATIAKVNILIVRCGTDGVLEVARGSSTTGSGLTFKDVFPNQVETLAYAATVDLDMSPNALTFKSVTLTGDIQFTTSNKGAGRVVTVRIVGDTVDRTFTFPAGWKFLGGPAPAALPANQVAILSITAFGTADTDIVAGFTFDTSETPLGGAGVASKLAYFSDSDSLTYTTELDWGGDGYGLGVGVSDATSKLEVGGSFTVLPDTVGSMLSVGGTLSDAGFGTHSLLSGLEVNIPTISGAGSTITNTASLYVAGQMSATVSGDNYSMWVDAGKSRFDGPLLFMEDAAPSTPSAGFGTLYAATDGYLYWKNDDGYTFNIALGAGGGAGSITGSGTANHIAFFTGASTLASESANQLYWNPTTKRMGIGVAPDQFALHVESADPPIEAARLSAQTNNVQASMTLRHYTSADMADGFAAGLYFRLGDSVAENSVGLVQGQRDGADNVGAVSIWVYNGASWVERIKARSSEVVVNEGGDDVDLRIEASGSANALFVQGSDGNIGIGASTPAYLLSAERSANTAERIEIKNVNAGTASQALFQASNGTHTIQYGIAGTGYTGSAMYGADDAFIQANGAELFIGSIGGGSTGDVHIVSAESGVGNFERVNFKGTGEVVFNDLGRDYDLRIEASGSANALFVQGSNGSIGMGTNTPTGNLQISGTNAGPYIDRYSTSPAHMLLRSAKGTVGAPTAIQSGNPLGYFTFAGYDGASFGEGPRVEAIASQTWTGAAHGASMRFRVVQDGTTTQISVLDLLGAEAVFNEGGLDYDLRVEATGSTHALFVQGSDGNIGISQPTPTSKLEIAGTYAPSASAIGSMFSVGGTITEASSGTHALLAGVEINAPTVTGAAATVTNTASLYVSGAMSATVTGKNYGLWVDGGETRLDGDVLHIGANDYQIRTASTTTTDATVTTIDTIATATDTTYMIKTEVVGKRTGGAGGTANDGAVYIRTARVKNNAGTVTINNLQTDYTSEDQAGWDATMNVSGTNIVVQVTGAASNNVSWVATTTVSPV